MRLPGRDPAYPGLALVGRLGAQNRSAGFARWVPAAAASGAPDGDSILTALIGRCGKPLDGEGCGFCWPHCLVREHLDTAPRSSARSGTLTEHSTAHGRRDLA